MVTITLISKTGLLGPPIHHRSIDLYNGTDLFIFLLGLRVNVVVCCPHSPSKQDKEIVKSTIANLFNDNGKFFVTWFVNGSLMMNDNDLISLFTSAFASTTSSRPHHTSHSYHSRHVSEFGTSGSSQGFYSQPPFASSSQYDPQLHDIKRTQPFKVVLPPSKTVMLITHLRYGQISKKPEDVEYQVPEFVVPDYVETDLLRKWSKQSDAELVILLDESGELISQVDKKTGNAWQPLMKINLDETVLLQTRIRNGYISSDKKDVLYRHSNWKSVPQHVSEALKKKFRSKFNLEIIFISDSQGNLRCVVKDDSFRELCYFESV